MAQMIYSMSNTDINLQLLTLARAMPAKQVHLQYGVELPVP